MLTFHSARRVVVTAALFLAQAWGHELDVMFVLETSPGTEQQINLIRPRDLQENDRAGVIGFFQSAQVLQELTQDREAVAKALQRAGARIAIGIGAGSQDIPNTVADLSGALRRAFREFGEEESLTRKRVVVLLAASEDPGLMGNLSSLKTMLATGEISLFAVAITRVSGPSYTFPVSAAQSLNQLAKASGGRLFRGAWDLKSILAAARKP